MTALPPPSKWQFAHRGPDAYERYLVPAIFGPWSIRTVEWAEIVAGERVLDAACGTGIVARAAADRVGSAGAVVGVDLNPAMIAVARDVSAGIQPPIAYHEGDMQRLPFPDHSFDVAVCQFSLMFMPDPRAALTELRRVLVPGGRVVLTLWRSLQHNVGWSLFATALERHVGADAAAIMRTPFSLGDERVVSELLASAGFNGVRTRIDTAMTRFPSPNDMLSRQAASSPLAGPIDALDPATLSALQADLAASLGPYTDDEGVAFPSTAHLLLAVR